MWDLTGLQNIVSPVGATHSIIRTSNGISNVSFVRNGRVATRRYKDALHPMHSKCIKGGSFRNTPDEKIPLITIWRSFFAYRLWKKIENIFERGMIRFELHESTTLVCWWAFVVTVLSVPWPLGPLVFADNLPGNLAHNVFRSHSSWC